MYCHVCVCLHMMQAAQLQHCAVAGLLVAVRGGLQGVWNHTRGISQGHCVCEGEGIAQVTGWVWLGLGAHRGPVGGGGFWLLVCVYVMSS